MSDNTAPRGHILTITKGDDFDPRWPVFGYNIECLNKDKCGGVEVCVKDHTVDGRSAQEGPYECDDNAPWSGCDDFEFHGVIHHWHYCIGWTTPYPGCVVADAEVHDDANDIGIEHGPGRYAIEDDWDDFNCRLDYVSKLPEAEATA